MCRAEKGYAQQDAEECWATLVRCLGQKLPPLPLSEGQSASAANLVAQMMTGEMQSTMVCKESGDEQKIEQHEPFIKLMCHISGTTNFLSTGLNEVCINPLFLKWPLFLVLFTAVFNKYLVAKEDIF
jgi:hypothetical protein